MTTFNDVVRYCACGCGIQLRLRSQRDVCRKHYASHQCRAKHVGFGSKIRPKDEALKWKHGRRNHPKSEVICEICNRVFMGFSSYNRFCYVCVPGRGVERRFYHSIAQRYGIGKQTYDGLVERSKNVCEICHNPWHGKEPFIDHDHTNGKVRGLLCCSCNYLVGLLENKLDFVHDALHYIAEH